MTKSKIVGGAVGVPEPSAKIENKYKCVKKLWNKFSPAARRMYNSVIEHSNYTNTMFPGVKLTLEQWKMLRHNFACVAAWSV